MGYEKRDYFICDRCGETVEMDSKEVFERRTGIGIQKFRNKWILLSDRCCLCPECAKLFFKEEKRHKNRLIEIIGKFKTAELYGEEE